ncbi:MAG: hypothetical protein QOF48_2378, partial [Verrucomicrobiota bacterium]
MLPPVSPWTCLLPGTYQTNGTSSVVRIAAESESRFYRLRRLVPVVAGQSGFWQLNEGGGAVSGDSSGSGAALSLSSVSWAAGRFGPGSLQFNGGTAAAGSRAWVSNTNYRVLPASGQSFSVSLWFNPDSVSAGSRGLIGNPGNGTNGWQVTLQTPGPGTNQLIFSSIGTGGSLSVTGRTSLLPGQWHALTVTHDGAKGSIYLDSELLAEGMGAIVANASPIYFGGGIAGLSSFLGRFDDIHAYTNCLTMEQIAMTGHWRFDEGCGAFAGDSSIQAHHGSVTDATAWASGHEGTGLDLGCGQAVIPNDDYAVLPRTGAPFSISFWLRPTSLAPGRSGLMKFGSGAADGWQMALQVDLEGATSLQFNSTNSGGTLDLWAPVPLAAGTWTKLDVTYNGGVATAYADGRKIQAAHGSIRGSKAALVVGSAPGATNFNGLIDDLKTYSCERGESDVGPVASTTWETVFINSATNLVLAGSGPAGKPLTFSILPTLTPTNGTVGHSDGGPIVAYNAGDQRGPDAFMYTVSDGEFTSRPAILTVSVVQPHWLSTNGGATQPLDGSSPAQAWAAGGADALDAIWKTNNY